MLRRNLPVLMPDRRRETFAELSDDRPCGARMISSPRPGRFPPFRGLLPRRRRGEAGSDRRRNDALRLPLRPGSVDASQASLRSPSTGSRTKKKGSRYLRLSEFSKASGELLLSLEVFTIHWQFTELSFIFFVPYF